MRKRLVWDYTVSTTCPVVRHTWVSVNELVERIMEGYTWSDIFRMYPEIDDRDLRAALAWRVHHAG